MCGAMSVQRVLQQGGKKSFWRRLVLCRQLGVNHPFRYKLGKRRDIFTARMRGLREGNVLVVLMGVSPGGLPVQTCYLGISLAPRPTWGPYHVAPTPPP